MRDAHIAFQPIVCSTSAVRRAYEVLARLPTGNGGYVGPVGHLHSGEWSSLDLAIIGRLANWVAAGNRLRHPLYINISAETLSCEVAFGAWSEQYLKFRFHDHVPIMIEVNECVSSDVLEHRWCELSRFGLGVALDDFGTESASLERLLAFPWSACKFESHTLYEPDAQRALHHIKQHNLISIVERIETQAERDKAASVGVTLHQGHYYAKPQLVATEYAVASEVLSSTTSP